MNVIDLQLSVTLNFIVIRVWARPDEHGWAVEKIPFFLTLTKRFWLIIPFFILYFDIRLLSHNNGLILYLA